MISSPRNQRSSHAAPAAAPSGAFADLIPNADEAQSRSRIEGIKARLDKARTEAGGQAGYEGHRDRQFTREPVPPGWRRDFGGQQAGSPARTPVRPSPSATRRRSRTKTSGWRAPRRKKGLLGTAGRAAASLPLAVATGGGAAATIPKLIGQGAVMGAASGAAQHAESPETAVKGALEGGAEAPPLLE